MLNSIQNLRALAAYSVVVFHCLGLYLFPTDPIGQGYLGLPSHGVDLFFVISGFVMVYTTKDNESPAWFMFKRIARIVPVYWAATLFCVAIILVRPWAFPYADIAPESILTSLLFIPHPDLGGGPAPILSVGWTLNYEMYFYLLFALSLALPKQLRLVGVVSLITAIWAACQFGGGNFYLAHYGNPIVFEFAVGCIVAYALKLPRIAAFVRATPMWPLALAGFVGLLATPLLVGMPPRLRTILPIALLVFTAAAQDMYRKPARETFVTRLGDASYSAYLLHTIVMALIHMVFIVIWKDEIQLNMWSYMVVVLVATIGGSLVLVSVLERPSAAWIRNLARRPTGALAN